MLGQLLGVTPRQRQLQQREWPAAAALRVAEPEHNASRHRRSRERQGPSPIGPLPALLPFQSGLAGIARELLLYSTHL